MTTKNQIAAAARLTGALLLAAQALMIAGAAIVVPAGLTLNPDDVAGTLAAVREHVVLHLVELALDVLGWLALATAGLAMAAHGAMAGNRLSLLPAGLLALAGTAGVLHDAGNLAVTQLSGDPAYLTIGAAEALLLSAKWTVNLAGLLWVAATALAVRYVPVPGGIRRAGALVVLSGLAGVVLPWTTGTDGPTVVLEQLGYALHLPVMIWFGVLGGWYLICARGGTRTPTSEDTRT